MKLKVTLKKSIIGSKPFQRNTIRSLGLKKINNSVIKIKNPCIMGMINKVSHMVSVEEVK